MDLNYVSGKCGALIWRRLVIDEQGEALKFAKFSMISLASENGCGSTKIGNDVRIRRDLAVLGCGGFCTVARVSGSRVVPLVRMKSRGSTANAVSAWQHHGALRVLL
jgi:hypothetical protein